MLIKISSGLQYKNQGFLSQIYAAFSVAPITQGVSPPSVLAINKSFSVKPKSYICYTANSGWSSKSSTDFIKATSPKIVFSNIYK